MRNNIYNTFILLLLIILLIFTLYGCGKNNTSDGIDEHEGQVLINDGINDVWITPVEDVEVNELTESDFSVEDDDILYTGDFFDVKKGIDVSYHQYDISWDEVANAGIDFAIIRAGYRGYTIGGISTDEYFESNIKGATENGIPVGVYFFSQAINITEAIEEAEYCLNLVSGYQLDLPIFFDWESEPDYRVYGLSFETMNDCAIAFCDTVKNAGYSAGIYFSKQLGYYAYDLERINDYVFWVTDPGDFPSFYYAGDIWQYSIDTATISGISTPIDLNMMFIKPES